MQIDTPIFTRPFVKERGIVPTLADREFWSPILMARQSQLPPDIIYSLVTSSGDRFIDSSSNQFIAVT